MSKVEVSSGMKTAVGGSDEPEDVNALKQQLDEAQKRIDELERQREEVKKATGGGMEEMGTLPEATATLRRLVQRIAMILQAEKIVVMFYDRDTGELGGIPPAYGIDDERLKMFRMRATQGISGQVFRDNEPVIFHDAAGDPRTQKDPFSIIGVQNGITVPLVIEKRDEENRVVERTTIGVLHAFNKRHGEDFNDEDVRLLERMARNVGAIIANLQLYREVLEEREELLQTFESLAAGLVLISPEGRISQMNASARTLFGIAHPGQKASDVIGKQYSDIIQNEGFKDLYKQAMDGEDMGSVIEISVQIANIDRVYQCQAAQVRGEDGKSLGIVAIMNDITDMKNIDRMKSSFVAMASHELRTPLTAIKGFVSTLLMDDGFSDDERREFYMIIDQECDRLTRLINDLLNTARIEAQESLKPHYTQVDLTALLEKTLLIQKQSTTRHDLKLDIRSPLPKIIADEDKLDQVLTNLLNNAIKYSPNGGEIIIHVVRDEHWITIGIQDQGLGIPKDQLNKVFDKFHRVNNEDNRRIYGTGLGLFLVKHLVESVHLGKIWVESEIGKGSTFLFRIPVELDVEMALQLNS